MFCVETIFYGLQVARPAVTLIMTSEICCRVSLIFIHTVLAQFFIHAEMPEERNLDQQAHSERFLCSFETSERNKIHQPNSFNHIGLP